MLQGGGIEILSPFWTRNWKVTLAPFILELRMRWEHFEVWADKKGRWELIGAFLDHDVASAVARNYTYRMKVVHAVFEDGKRIEEQTLVELGSTREHA